MRRLFWLGVGATVGAVVVRKASRAAESMSPSGLGASLSGLGDAMRVFAEDVRNAMAEHEADLMSALGVDADGTAAAGVTTPAAGGAPSGGPRSHRAS